MRKGFNKILSVAFLLAISFTVSASAGEAGPAADSLRNFVGNIGLFNRLFPQEKAYLHFDNTGYFRGETMWFSAYVVRTDRKALSDMSRVLYVELLDPTGEVVETRKVRLDGGRGSGSIKLDRLLTSGFYEVRAYTRYMLNWDAGWAFSRVLPVFDAPKEAGDYGHPSIVEPDYRKRLPSVRAADTASRGPVNVAFYPEGGRLVAGLGSRVAFAVTDGDGRPLDTGGTLMLPDGRSVAVSTLREGRGVFDYTPSQTPATLVMADGKGVMHRFTLPAADAEGCVMSVDAVDSGYVYVDISRSEGFSVPLALVLVNGGNVDGRDIIVPGEAHSRRRFSKADMEPGVSQLALIRPDGGIVAERMVFVHPRGGVDSISVRAVGTLSPCGRLRLEARTAPGATFSVSVRDAAGEVNGSSGDAATWLLLTSDLRGYIHRPEYYLESDDEAHRRAADLLMMVQGWRRYDMAQMDGTARFERRHPIEDGLYLYGRLHRVKRKDPLGGVRLTATLYKRDGSSMGGVAVTDSAGQYAFSLPDCEGEWAMLLNTATASGKPRNYRVGIDRNFSPPARALSPQECCRQPGDGRRPVVVVASDFDMQSGGLSMDERVHMLKEVRVKGRRPFDNARPAWESQQRGAYKSYLRYDCDKASDEIYDRGEETPEFMAWLAGKNSFFSGSTDDMDALKPLLEGSDQMSEVPEEKFDERNRIRVSLVSDEKVYISADQERGNYDETAIGHVLNLQKRGLSYKKRPVIWILNNNFYCISDAPASISLSNIKFIHHYSSEFMPIYLDEVKSVFISEDDEIWKHYVQVPDIELYSPVTVFVYSHHVFPQGATGLRRTFYDGYSRVETFSMPDYSVMPREVDHRRTLYWNPEVKADGSGLATMELYNNSSCRSIVVSAEGMTPDGRAVVYK